MILFVDDISFVEKKKKYSVKLVLFLAGHE